jgi:phage-related minor tail protein
MVRLRDGVPEPVKQLGAKLKSVVSNFTSDEQQAEAARQRFEKAMFHSHYTVDEFEQALDQHRDMMRELGNAIQRFMKEFRKRWKKAQKLGPHEGKAERALAKTYFRRIIAFEERIDAHLRKFEEKLDVLTAWRQYKIENDIGTEVDVGEVKEFMAETLDEFEVTETSIEEQTGDQLTTVIRGENSDGVMSEEDEELLDQFVEEMDEEGRLSGVETGAEASVDANGEVTFPGNDSGDAGNSGEAHDVDDELEMFVDEELD